MLTQIRLKYLCVVYLLSAVCTGSAQSKSLTIISDLNKRKFYTGDTICFTIKNESSINRGYTIEARIMNPDKEYNTEVYTAYFNNDSLFFKALKKNKDSTRYFGGRYIMPDAHQVTYDIAANECSVFKFVVRGKKNSKGVEMKLIISSDLLNDEQDVIETKSFLLFATPF